jgi:PTH1 family peptidyl-tRNA hydrolase
MVLRGLGRRHDLGSAVVRRLGSNSPASFRAHRAPALVDEVWLGTSAGVAAGGHKAVLAIPTTYMNESGGPVSALLKFYSADIGHLIVVHDELDIPSGVVRVKRGGGEGGHNGLRSVTRSLGTQNFLRVRVGIGRPPGRMDPAEFVLRDFTAAERADLPLTINAAADAVESLIELGLLATQQRFHTT